LNLIHAVVQQLTGHWVWGEAVQKFSMPMSINITNDGYYNCSIPKLLVIWEVHKAISNLAMSHSISSAFSYMGCFKSYHKEQCHQALDSNKL
jgi:hypothetical protein